MAFIDFNEAALQAPCAAAAQALEPKAAEAQLSQVEQRVIELARHDGLASLRPVRKRGRLARLVFGPDPVSRQLANERLEALRKLAVQAWNQGYTVPASTQRETLAAGYSEAQVGAVLDLIGRARGAVVSRVA
ncbi:hypothetical protein I5E68_10815 [Novosphingobium sp. YJ-S2-02]|uniref:Uncharacterized protein n=1 Tax=Novosphingobium aureum TaxID=2792964 RepID=A0A931MLI2_9SPHN|nr:hypothetical protein [Novosphingobium aureum]MBH0113440.1 hypothetical protein [Novosphingobium aureum]